MRRRNSWVVPFILTLLAVGGIFGFVYFSPYFEREAPKVDINSTLYWNFKTPLKIKLSDNYSLGEYKVEIIEKGRSTVLAQGNVPKGQKELALTLLYPKNAFLPTAPDAKLVIKASDRSLWKFFSPNRLDAEIPVVCDINPPQASVIANSYSISKGGSALVVFEARDDNLKDVSIKTASGKVFKAQPFVKKGFYAALVAWGLKDDSFMASVVATDLAGNETSVPVNFYAKNIAYKDTKLMLKDDFLNQKIMELSSSMNATSKTTPLERFAYVNNTLRDKNEKLIAKITNRVGDNVIDGFFTDPFVPIASASVVGSFGDHRSFYMGNDLISESYHKGIDFASVKEAPVLAPNNGVVVYTAPNGIYGNMIVLYHGLGLFTLYGHCSSFVVKEGDLVSKNQVIARTGMTGLAFGDHLHYGVLVQGVEVRPLEWLDAKWIKLNVTDIMQVAKQIIASKK